MDIQPVLSELESFLPLIERFFSGLLRPWPLIQIALFLLCFAAAHFLNCRFSPRLEAWARGLSDVPKARLRLLVIFLRRLRALLFLALVWASVLTLKITTWPSRSYLLTILASLVTAWVFVAISSRMIRNRALGAVVAWSAWIYVTIAILGFRENAETLLDGLAIGFGEVNLSVLLVLKALVTIAVLVAVARWISDLAEGQMRRNEDISPSFRVLADKALRFGLYAIAAVIGLQSIGFDLTSLTVLSGAIGLGLGFGLQKVVSNLVSGVILLLDKSIKPGDVISLGDTFGWISQLGARYVAVITRDGREYLIPNEDLITGQVVNWSHSSDLVRLDIYFGVSYDSDPHQVRGLASKAAASVARVVHDPAPVCHIVGFGDSSIDFILRFWIRDPVGGLTNVRGGVFLALWDALKTAGIEIPYPRRDVEIRGSLQVARD